MAKATTKLTAQERVVLFCTATGISHTAVGITAHAIQSMAVRGFIAHNRETGASAPARSYQFKVEQWDKTEDHIIWLIAVSNNFLVARAAYDAAIRWSAMSCHVHCPRNYTRVTRNDFVHIVTVTHEHPIRHQTRPRRLDRV